jgi:hypothetical protein
VATIRFHAEEAFANLRAFREASPRATTRAINRAAASTQTLAIRDMSRDLGVRQTVVRQRMRLGRATWQRLVATLTVRGRPLSLLLFRARQDARGVTYRLRGQVVFIPSAFIATMPSGRRSVFLRRIPSTRKGRGAWGLNLPIDEQTGPSLPGVFLEADRQRRLGEKYRAEIVKQLEHEVAFELRRGR